MSTEKEKFIKMMKFKTRSFAIGIICFCNSLKRSKASSVITYQLIKSATSTGANYRAACKARSRKEFYSKLCIVAEEADETMFWLEVISGAGLYNDKNELKKLHNEALEITKVITKAKSNVY